MTGERIFRGHPTAGCARLHIGLSTPSDLAFSKRTFPYAPVPVFRRAPRADGSAVARAAARRTCRLLLALCAAGPRLGRSAVRCRLCRRVDRYDDPGIRRPGHHPRFQSRARLADTGRLAAAPRHGVGPAGRAAVGDAAAEHDHQPGDHPRVLQPDPLAEPLARGAAELDLLSERFRRANRATGHADRPVAARKRRLGHEGRLVHPCLWRRRDLAARLQRCRGWRSRCCCGSPATRSCCAGLFRACAPARGGCRRRARPSPAASSTATPTS